MAPKAALSECDTYHYADRSRTQYTFQPQVTTCLPADVESRSHRVSGSPVTDAKWVIPDPELESPVIDLDTLEHVLPDKDSDLPADRNGEAFLFEPISYMGGSRPPRCTAARCRAPAAVWCQWCHRAFCIHHVRNVSGDSAAPEFVCTQCIDAGGLDFRTRGVRDQAEFDAAHCVVDSVDTPVGGTAYVHTGVPCAEWSIARHGIKGQKGNGKGTGGKQSGRGGGEAADSAGQR